MNVRIDESKSFLDKTARINTYILLGTQSVSYDSSTQQ